MAPEAGGPVLTGATDWRVPLVHWLGFAAMCLGMFLAILDIQIVASALPELQAGLKIPMTSLSWTQTAYLIAEVIAITLTGWLGRALSTGGLFVIAVVGFTVFSVGCAESDGFYEFIVFRTLQGLFGGAIIPTVFTVGYRLFPPRLQARATMIAGVFAMTAPALGPLIGGYIAESANWRWLFLVNVGPGVAVALVVAATIRVDRGERRLLTRVDAAAVLLLTLFLAGIELFLKQGSGHGWLAPTTLGLLVIVLASGPALARRCLRSAEPLVDFTLFRDPWFAAGCWYSFVLGMGLYGATYLMPLFLGFVRDHEPLDVGLIMVVTGAAQLACAPLAVALEKRFDPLRVAGAGFALLGVGMIINGDMTPGSDFDALLAPQILRGAAAMLCLLPITTLALGHQPANRLGDASALFNLMRNLGGAVGLALIDTVLEGRTPGHALDLVARLQAGSPEAAKFVGLPLDRFHNIPLGPVDAATEEMVRPLVEKAAAVMAFNDAWLLIGALACVSLVALPLLPRLCGVRPGAGQE